MTFTQHQRDEHAAHQPASGPMPALSLRARWRAQWRRRLSLAVATGLSVLALLVPHRAAAVTTAPTITQFFNPVGMAPGAVGHLYIILNNGANNSAATLTADFVETLPANLVLASPLNISGSCTSTGTTSATAGGSTLKLLSGSTIAASTNCLLLADVVASTYGVLTNNIAAGALVTGFGNNPSASSASVTIAVAPTVTAAYAPATVPANSSSVFTVTLGNPNAAAATLVSTYTNYLQANVTLASATFGGTCTGTVTGVVNGTSFTYANGATIPGSNGSCTIIANVNVTTGGASDNMLAGSLQTSNGNNTVSTSASLSTSYSNPTVTSSFTPSSIIPGNNSVLTLTLGNTNSVAATLSSNLLDTLPAGVSVAATPGLGGTCSSAQLSSAANSVSYLAGGTIPINGSCTITINVTSSTAGTTTNTIGVNALVTNLGNNNVAGSSTLTVYGPATIAIRLTTLNGVGTSIVNLTALSNTTDSVTTVTAGVSAGSSQVNTGSPAGTPLLYLQDTPGYAGQSVDCVDSNSAVTGHGSHNSGGASIILPADTMTPGTMWVCSFIQTAIATVTLKKAIVARALSTDQFSLAIGGGPTATTSGISLSATTADFAGTLGTAYTLSESAAGSPLTLMGRYSTSYTCVNNYTGSGASAGSSGSGVTSFSVTLASYDKIVCTFTNTPVAPILALKGVLTSTRAVPTDQFTVQIKKTGVLQNATTNSTTLGAGSSITGGSGVSGAVTGIAAATYGMYLVGAGTPTAALSNYSTSYSCVNSLAGATATLPSGSATFFTIIPVAGDITTCTFSTAAKSATLILRKTWVYGKTSDAVTLPASSGFVTNTAALNSVATGAASYSSQTSGVSTTIGATGTLFGETFSVGSASNYVVSAYVCTDGVTTLNVAAGANLTIPLTSASGTLICTLTNTRNPNAANSGLRIVTNNQYANGTAQDVLEAYAQDNLNTAFGAGAVFSFAATPNVAFNGGAVGAATTCTTTASSLCQVTATSLVIASTSSAVALSTVPLGGSFTAATNNYAPSAAAYTFVTPPPKLRVLLTTLSGSGSNTFSFALSGLTAGTDSITVTGVASGTGLTNLLATAGQAVSISQTAPVGWPVNPASASCVDLNSATPGATFGTLNGNQLSVPVAYVVFGADLRCTFINSYVNTVTGRVFLDNGAGGGSANDGVINGIETGQSGVALQLTNCASTVLSSAVTNNSGNYILNVPFSIVNGNSLCVQETNSGVRVSTGASVGSTVLPSGTPTLVAGLTYTYTRSSTPDQIAFIWNGNNPTGLNFGDVDASTFAASGAKTGQAGNAVLYPHTFTAGSGGSVSFSVLSDIAAPALAGWSTIIFADAACSGSLQAGAAILYPPALPKTVVAGQIVCILVRERIPVSALENNNDDVKVQAVMTLTGAAPALSASFSVDDITTVSNGALDLKKEVRNVTQSAVFSLNNQAKSGEVLEYRITYTNNGTGSITNLIINDTTPQFTTFAGSSAGSTPLDLSACLKNTPLNPAPAIALACSSAQAIGGTGAVNWQFSGALIPGASGTVLFTVKIN